MFYGIVKSGYLLTATEQDGKPVTFTAHEDAPQGYEYVAGWEDDGDTIAQTWTLVECPDPTPEEALDFLFGGES